MKRFHLLISLSSLSLFCMELPEVTVPHSLKSNHVFLVFTTKTNVVCALKGIEQLGGYETYEEALLDDWCGRVCLFFGAKQKLSFLSGIDTLKKKYRFKMNFPDVPGAHNNKLIQVNIATDQPDQIIIDLKKLNFVDKVESDLDGKKLAAIKNDAHKKIEEQRKKKFIALQISEISQLLEKRK